MATGVKVQSANYGVGSKTVDVTNAVSTQLKDGKLNFVVTPAALNVSDPAPGQLKTLTVKYTINGGSSNTTTATDGDAIQVDAPPARIATGLQIKKAQYGYEGNYADVTSAVRTYLNEGVINLTVSHGAVGIPDPNPQKPKLMKVDYEINGYPGSKTIPDGQRFTINAPPVATNTSETPTQGAMSIVGTITNDIFLFAWLWFLFSITIQSAKYGGTLFTGGYWLLGGLAFFSSGLFPILILPFLIFWWHVIFG